MSSQDMATKLSISGENMAGLLFVFTKSGAGGDDCAATGNLLTARNIDIWDTYGTVVA
jgi:hypothetical protein